VSSPRSLVWHPSVHARFRDELAFLLLSVKAFPKDGVYDELEKYLVASGHTAFRIYRVLGTVDIFLRVWVEKGRVDEFAKELERNLEYIAASKVVIVADIPHHWKYDRSVSTEALSRVTPELVKSLQENFEKPDNWTSDPVRSAIESLLVRSVTENKANILFFTGITASNTRALDVKALLTEIYSLFDIYKSLDKTAVFVTKGPEYAFLIKCETQDYFVIGEFIADLSHRIAVYRSGTVTSVVSDRQIRGREEIGWRSFKQVERRDITTAGILPELYDSEIVNANLRLAIEGWIRDHLVPNRDNMTEDEFKAVQACLRCVVKVEEYGFLSRIVEVFGCSERVLRKQQGRFVGLQMGPSEVAATMKAALAHKPNSEGKKSDLLALGDRLDIFAYVIKQKSLSSDADLVGNWDEEVSLRDQAAHFSEVPYQNWAATLTVLVRFLKRYNKLGKLISK